MKRSIMIGILAIGIAAVVSTQQASISQSPDAAAIKTLNEQYAAAVNAQDPARIVSLYATDAIYMNVNNPGLVGRDAIRTNFENSFKNLTVRDAASTSVESQVAGNWAFDRGRYTYTSVAKAGGQTTKVSYVFLQILEKQSDGSWKIKRRMFHSDQPAQ